MQCKYGSTNWNDSKDFKESYLVQLTEYAIENSYSEEPVFAWCVNFLMKKRERIFSKVKSKHWVRTQKYGIRGLKDIRKTKQIDTDNDNTLWWDAIMLKMKNVRPAFEVYKSKKKDLIGYQGNKCYFVFDIKL